MLIGANQRARFVFCSYGHYRIAYLIRSEDLIEILGIFHTALDIDATFERGSIAGL